MAVLAGSEKLQLSSRAQQSGGMYIPSTAAQSSIPDILQTNKVLLEMQAMISAADFAAGAQQLVTALACCQGSGGEAAWRWQPISSVFDRGPVST